MPPARDDHPRRHAFDHVSIRRILPGRHAIDVQVNGRVLGSIDVDVTPALLRGPPMT
jgi:hypothetical protein